MTAAMAHGKISNAAGLIPTTTPTAVLLVFNLCVTLRFGVSYPQIKGTERTVRSSSNVLALKRVRSLDFGSFHDFEAPDFGKLPDASILQG